MKSRIVRRMLEDREKFKSAYLRGKLEGREAYESKMRGASLDVDFTYGPFSSQEVSQMHVLKQKAGGSYAGAVKVYGKRRIDVKHADLSYLGDALGFASSLMELSLSTGDVRASLQAVRLYEKLGMGGDVFVQENLDKVVENAEKNGWFERVGNLSRRLYLEDVQLFRSRNVQEE